MRTRILIACYELKKLRMLEQKVILLGDTSHIKKCVRKARGFCIFKFSSRCFSWNFNSNANVGVLENQISKVGQESGKSDINFLTIFH